MIIDLAKNKNDTTHNLEEIETRLSAAKREFKNAVSTRRASMFLIIACAAALSLNYQAAYKFQWWITVLFWIGAALSLLVLIGTEAWKSQDEVEKLESIKRLYSGVLDVKTNESYFDSLVKINVENLSEYYSLVKKHSRQSFILSASVVVLGFVLIVAGVGIGFLDTQYRNISYVAAASGIIVNFIGGAVFVLYTRTVLQLKQYHDSLLDVQNILLAFKLIEGTNDSSERAKMTQRMIEFLSSRRAVLNN